MVRRVRLAGIALFASALAAQAQTPAAPSSFAWYGELVSFDAASRTVTAKAKIEPHVSKHVAALGAGDRVALVWKTFSGEADAITYVTRDKELVAESGYVVRASLVSIDAAQGTLTFSTPVSATAAQTLGAAAQGTPIRVSATLVPPATGSPVRSVALNKTAPARPKPVDKTPVVNARPVAGTWSVATSLMGNPATLMCDLIQDGPKLGGTCNGPGPLRQLGVTGGVEDANVTFQIAISQAGISVTILYRGTVNDAGTTIEGMSNLMGADSPFKATKQ